MEDFALLMLQVTALLHRLGRVLVGHALLEALDALGDVAHQFGNLAATEQQQDDRKDDQPMPDAETAPSALLDAISNAPPPGMA